MLRKVRKKELLFYCKLHISLQKSDVHKTSSSNLNIVDLIELSWNQKTPSSLPSQAQTKIPREIL